MNSLVLWKSDAGNPIATRVAVAGDFLPAGDLSIPAGGWCETTRAVLPLFADVAISFLNLECPLDSWGLPTRPLSGIGQIVSGKADSLEYLNSIRALVVGFANNHSYDFGAAGVRRTRNTLRARGFVPLGMARTLREPPEIFVWQGPGGVRIGFWAGARASRDLATQRTDGVEPATLARARAASTALKSQGATASIALLHAGCLRTNRPDPDDVTLMDSIASCGFDIVAASHSHRISGYRPHVFRSGAPTFCFCGLGSIVSGYIGSPLEREGLVVVAGFASNGTLASIEVRPVWLGQSGFAENPPEDSGSKILQRFCELSVELVDGTFAPLFYEDMSHGLIPLYARDLRAAFCQSGVWGLARKARRIRVRHVKRLLHAIAP